MPRALCRARRTGAVMTVYSSQSRQTCPTTGRFVFSPIVVRIVPLVKARDLVQSGKAHWKYPEKGFGRKKEPIGVVLLELERRERTSPAMLTCGETLANAGAHASDGFICVTRAKVTMWPLLGDTKAVAVRPRMSEQQRRQAVRLLASAK